MTWFRKYLRSYAKSRAIRTYTRQLPRLLSKDYGYSRSYTPKQVRRTVERSGLPVEYSCYAVAMFSDRENFNQFHHELGEVCDYDAMRAEIADRHFHGNAAFDVSDVFTISSEPAGGPGHNGTHDVGGGDPGSSHNSH